MADQVRPFHLDVPQAELDDLRRRLDATRWPEAETVEGWTQGVPLARAKALVDHWRTAYDWRRCEAMLNGFGQFKTELDGLDIHFLHARSPHPDALPLLITHGWPGSVVEFHKVIGPLTDPTAHGGEAGDAFHVVAPSLPGYGFSAKPATSGWTVQRIAAAWATLMARLGYPRWVAQGGDWGAAVTTALGVARPPGLAGIHLNMVIAGPTGAVAESDAEGQAALAAMAAYQDKESGYSKQQSTRPQTLGYGLADSPAGQAMWIYEKFERWTDCDGDPESVLTRDEMLDDIMLYWLPDTAASSARLYWESFGSFRPARIELPVGASVFPKEIFRPAKAWVEALFPELIHWNRLPRGGHFAAFEQPGLYVDEVRTCFRQLR